MTYCILSLLSHASEVNVRVRTGNTSFLMEAPTCSVRQDLAESFYAFSIVINEGNFGGYFKKYFLFLTFHIHYRFLLPPIDNSKLCVVQTE